MSTVAFHNLGCKVNSYEMDAMIELFIKEGFTKVAFTEKADIYVINTCSVTNIADRKSRQMISRARRENPEAVVVATGCYVETRDKGYLENEDIDLCVGNNRKSQIVNILKDYMNSEDYKKRQVVSKDDEPATVYDEISIESSDSRTRAFIKVQDGCNQFCSYCIIPYARGRVRSREKEHIINEIKGLAKAGYREFVITGIHLSSYGSDFIYEKQKANQFAPELLMDLLKSVNEIPGVSRIRLGSLEPRIITDSFVNELKKVDKLCPHFHLSLQSGAEKTLKAMNRHYLPQEYYESVCVLRRYYEHPAITTDVIVGFPGETEEDFVESKAFLDKVRFFEIHIFKYSKRQGTVAAAMKEQLTEKEKSGRSDRLEELEKVMSREFMDYYKGRTVKVLFEEEKELEGKKYWVGHTPEYVKVACELTGDCTNAVLDVDITDYINKDDNCRILTGVAQ